MLERSTIARYQTLIHLGCGANLAVSNYIQLAEEVWLVDADGDAINQLQETYAETSNLHLRQEIIATEQQPATFYHYNLAWANGLEPIDEAKQRLYPGLRCIKTTQQLAQPIDQLVAEALKDQDRNLLILDLGEQNEPLLQALEESEQLTRFTTVILLPAHRSTETIKTPPSLHGPAPAPEGLQLPEYSQVLTRHPLAQELQNTKTELKEAVQLSDEKAKQVESLKKDKDSLKQQLAEREQQLAERDQQLTELTQQWDEKAQQTDNATKARDELKQHLAEREKQLAERTQQRDEKAQQADNVTKARDELKQQLAERDKQLAERTQQRDEKAQQADNATKARDELKQQLAERDKQLAERTQQRDEKAQQADNAVKASDELKQQLDDVNKQKEHALHQNHLNNEAKISAQKRLQLLQGMLEESQAKASQVNIPILDEDGHDNFYRAFEDRFRGSREEIKKRVRVYLPFVLPIARRHPDVSALDLGCGRGEWLEVLREEGILAEGVDQDAGMLTGANDEGLKVSKGDAITYLQEQPDASRICISLMHVVEHLPFDAVRYVVAEAKRVLVPDGILIMETPNPENFMVGSCNFYMDPTHRNPLPPPLLGFVPEYYGFSRIKIMRLQETEDTNKKSHFGVEDFLTKISPDYAILARSGNLSEQDVESNEADIWNQEYGISFSNMAERNSTEKLASE